jgi:Alginate export
MGIGSNGVLDIGGSYRIRAHNESNMSNLGLTGNSDQFLLHQTRLYANLEVGSALRFYLEGIDATRDGRRQPARAIDENRADILNLFADVRLHDSHRGTLSLRVGRQELIYGNQRLISPLPWGNTRRTWEGAKLAWKGTSWDAQAFWTNPVRKNTIRLDSPDQSRKMSGLYTTYHAVKDQTIDLFYLRSDESDGAGYEYNTFGSRWQGSRDRWMWEGLVAGQFGEVAGSSQQAWAFTTGLGHKFTNACWTPAFWAWYDYATGSDNGVGRGFNQYLPLSHKYLGFMDFFGRSNIKDANFQMILNPHDKLKFLAWWHIFHLQNGGDVPYNANMTPFVATPGGSRYLGQELDLMASLDVSPRMNLVMGYSHFFAGDWYSTNPDAPFAGDADFVYTQFILEF